MTRRERVIAAIELHEPDDIVPTYELEFHLSKELLGEDFPSKDEFAKADGRFRKLLIERSAELFLKIAERLDYSVIRIWGLPDEETEIAVLKRLRELVGREYLLAAHADGTLGIPSGEDMLNYVYTFIDRPGEMRECAEMSVRAAIERGRRLIEVGADIIDMCVDYCFNSGPFLSPRMFTEFVTPYLARQTAAFQAEGAYVVKHTDGDIMPILDQLIDSGINVLHSLDPIAGIDIGRVKELVGHRICLMGNVSCVLLHTGTKEEIIKASQYCLEKAMPGGGFIFSTSNVPFKGMPLENYLLMLETREKYGRYDSYRTVRMAGEVST